MTPEHEKQADAAERKLEDMEERAERLGEQIGDTRDDWESKKADPGVPGAAGDPQHAEAGGEQPEAAYPAKGSDEQLTEEDPTGDDDARAEGEESADDEDEEERAP